MLNCRLGSDYTSPKPTCKDRSTVDYILTSAENFKMISSFQILDFDSLYSDAHCPLVVSLHIYKQNIIPETSQFDQGPKPKLWDDSKKNAFVEHLNYEEIREISLALDALGEQSIVPEYINRITNRIENLFSSNAENTFGIKTKKQKLHKYHKPWFNQECKVARNSYHSVRKKYNKYKTTYYKNLLKTVSKQYKSTISKNVRKYKDDKVNRLKNLQTSNPKEYWKIINSLDKKKDRL